MSFLLGIVLMQTDKTYVLIEVLTFQLFQMHLISSSWLLLTLLVPMEAGRVDFSNAGIYLILRPCEDQ